jgi:wyosine [tRNA(Phe)-imidazoG37] synthetase (radical SAM superfamily)
MSTLQASEMQQAVFGPYDSRRFGRSLAVNPLPSGSRLCNFDCIYCDCAEGSWPIDWDLQPRFPSAETIHEALFSAAGGFAADDLDSIVITGNGEPTLSPHLNEIVDVVNLARDRVWPQARTLILSNGAMCHKFRVRNALSKLDQRVIKLDAGSDWIFDQLNRPMPRLSMSELLRRIALTPEIVVQSMFVHGPIDNTGPKEIELWAGWLTRLKPAAVQIYSFDRRPTKSWVRHVSRNELESIARYVETTTGIPSRVF